MSATVVVVSWLNDVANPDSVWLLAVLALVLVVGLFVALILHDRTREDRAAARTKRIESLLKQENTDEHIWDGWR